MKYVVLLTEPDHWARWAALSDDEQQQVFDSFGAFDKALAERGGEIIGGEGLTPPAEGRTLQPGPDRLVTQGPYSEVVEQLGGFFIVTADSVDTVVEAARALPDTCRVEVRPVEGSVS